MTASSVVHGQETIKFTCSYQGSGLILKSKVEVTQSAILKSKKVVITKMKSWYLPLSQKSFAQS